ncbi:MAG: GAF domain-containing protein [Chloroflexi bacterium]|nr:GAF domain-containing protein [Chloroflexota bacterium]
MSDQDHILVVVSDPKAGAVLDRTLRSAEYAVTWAQDGASALRQAPKIGASLVLLSERLRDGAGIDIAAEFNRRYPALPVILFVSNNSLDLMKRAMGIGIADIICTPFRTGDLLRSVRSVLDLSKRRKESLLLESRRFTSSLKRQMDDMEMLMRLGRQITSSLTPDSVLTAIVDAAVELTGAEEGSLLLIDPDTGELYMRAARNFQDEFVRTFRLAITDSLAGSVIRSGEPVLVDGSTPQKIKTSYLVQSLLYVPLQMNGRVFGVLGVDNRHSRLPLTQKHVKLLSMLASYAVIALENARLYEEVINERNKLETILTGIHDGVIVVDQDERLGIVNKTTREAFAIDPDVNLTGKRFEEVFSQPELTALIKTAKTNLVPRTEISPDGDRFYSAMLTPIQGVGQVFTLHDITYLKKLDSIKTDFVHTVSHDLRSPLTAILGYVELIERAGPVSDLQRDFIRRVKVSVSNITRLVDNLLELGRIESGFDLRKENLSLDQLIRFSTDGFKKRIEEKNLDLQLNLAEDFPSIFANPVQMRQMIDHLVENAVKYTPSGGSIKVTAGVHQDQVIFQVSDTGIGIPAIDQPFIFDKFYRASNASLDISGTGLGLAIVKSIVENHGGRIWLDSADGKGASFTVVLPLLKP